MFLCENISVSTNYQLIRQSEESIVCFNLSRGGWCELAAVGTTTLDAAELDMYTSG